MKNLITLIIVVGFAALSAVCIVEWRKVARDQAQLQTTQAQLEQKSQTAEELQTANQRLKVQHRELERKVAILNAHVEDARMAPAATASVEAPATNTEPASSTNKLGGVLAKMLSDPDMKTLIRNQQRLVMDQFYGPLIKQLGLTPDQADKFKELLMDRQMKAVDAASAVFAGGARTNSAEALKAINADQAEFDEQVKALLGDSGYAQYKDYETTLSERVQLNQFKQQMSGDTAPLTDVQTDQLLAIMKDENDKMKTATGQAFAQAGQNQTALDAFMSDDQMQKLLDNQAAVSQHVIERAQAVLSPEQWQAFGRFQTNQLQLVRMSMTMARKLFAPDNSGAVAPSNP